MDTFKQYLLNLLRNKRWQKQLDEMKAKLQEIEKQNEEIVKRNEELLRHSKMDLN